MLQLTFDIIGKFILNLFLIVIVIKKCSWVYTDSILIQNMKCTVYIYKKRINNNLHKALNL